MEEGSLSRTVAFDCGHGYIYAEEEYTTKRGTASAQKSQPNFQRYIFRNFYSERETKDMTVRCRPTCTKIIIRLDIVANAEHFVYKMGEQRLS